MMFLSVIIPTRNRAEMLRGFLESIRNQTLAADKFEVIVIDNGSEDKTKEVCECYQRQIRNLSYATENQAGLHRGRHAGMQKATGDILVFADDDIQALPTWLEGIVEAFENPNVILVGGKCLPLFESKPPSWLDRLWYKQNSDKRILPYLSLLDLGDSIKEISPFYVFGCNFSIRKHILLEAGGFHPDAMPPELIRYRGDGETHVSRYIQKKGLKALYHPEASVYHYVPRERMTVQFLRKRYYAQGISDSYTQIRNGDLRYHWIMIALRTVKNLPLIFTDSYKAQAFMAYLRGYIFHRMEVRKDPALYAWVMLKNYLE